MAPRSLPIWGTPDGWIPEKMRGRGARAATGDGAGRISVAIPAECTGRSFAADARGCGLVGSRPRVRARARTCKAGETPFRPADIWPDVANRLHRRHDSRVHP